MEGIVRFRWPAGKAVVMVSRHVYERDLKKEPDPAVLVESQEVIGSNLAAWIAAGFEVIGEDKPREERKEGVGDGPGTR